MSGHTTAPERPATDPPEVDDFGLPIRKPRREVAETPDSEDHNKPIEAEDKVSTPTSTEQKSNGISQAGQGETSGNDVLSQEAQEAPSVENQASGNIQDGNEGAFKDTGTKKTQEHETHRRVLSTADKDAPKPVVALSEYSHQALVSHKDEKEQDQKGEEELEWQEMPAYAPYDIYNDDGKLIAREAVEQHEEEVAYGNLGGAGKGYTRVQLDEDAQSATSMDDNTAYLFKERGTNVQDEDDEARDVLSQMQATKDLLTEMQRIAYVAVVRLAQIEMLKDAESLERTRGAKKQIDAAVEALKMWSQKVMIRLYSHMDLDSKEQIMIESLAEHGVLPGDLTPSLLQNARVKNPVAEPSTPSLSSTSTFQPNASGERLNSPPITPGLESGSQSPVPLPYDEVDGTHAPEAQIVAQLPKTRNIDIDLRWTVLCDLFLILISDSAYDARSRQLLEKFGSYLDVPWIEICRFEKRVTDALEMQEAADKENWNEAEHMENRKKSARNRRLVMMGLATVGGGLVIGLSAGLLAPVIGAGLAAGFTTIGVAGTGTFLGGAGGAAVVTTTGVLAGSTIGGRAADRRTGAVKTFEYRPLHNNKRVNLVVTISGWMSSKVDDVRLPFSTVDPMMGDIYSVYWEPEMLRSMGDTINILATEALTQALQQVLGSTILIALMAALQAPVLLTKLSYLIDNPWSVSQARADLAGLILADSLMERNLGVRPVTLVGFSLGARVIYSCLQELAKKGAHGLVQNVYMFGTPIVAKKDECLKARTVVSGRFVNGYATNDWILGYLFRATTGGIMRVAGLSAIELPGVENFNVTELVPGHMAYRTAMPRLLRECGWLVESDEFTEIEDPDPDNHDKRQRELINEIEEARKELEKKPEKKRFGLFGRNKKLAGKKEWETYDERMKEQPPGVKEDASLEEKASGVLFDIDAIQREAAALTAQGIQVKEIESTLPPMKINMAEAATSNKRESLRESLRPTKSFDDSIGPATTPTTATAAATAIPSTTHNTPMNGHTFDDYDEFATNESEISMTFDTSYKAPTAAAPAYTPTQSSYSLPERPPLQISRTSPMPNMDLGHNAWADEDEDFGQEKEIKMTFA